MYKIEVSPGHHHGEILKTYKWVGSLSESVKKEKFMTKIFFPDNVVWSSTNWQKMISADVKAKIKLKK